MGYAARRNPTAQHYASPEGVATLREEREQNIRTADVLKARAQAAEYDRLVADVNAPDAVRRFGPVRLALAKALIARMEAARG